MCCTTAASVGPDVTAVSQRDELLLSFIGRLLFKMRLQCFSLKVSQVLPQRRVIGSGPSGTAN